MNPWKRLLAALATHGRLKLTAGDLPELADPELALDITWPPGARVCVIDRETLDALVEARDRMRHHLLTRAEWHQAAVDHCHQLTAELNEERAALAVHRQHGDDLARILADESAKLEQLRRERDEAEQAAETPADARFLRAENREHAAETDRLREQLAITLARVAELEEVAQQITTARDARIRREAGLDA